MLYIFNIYLVMKNKVMVYIYFVLSVCVMMAVYGLVFKLLLK